MKRPSILRTSVIMQPTYLPWLGYFDLMDQCDVFVFLDSVQFEKRSWQQRNRIKTAQNELWLTVPVFSRHLRQQKIYDVCIDRSTDFQRKHLGAIKHAYAKAQYFERYMPHYESIVSKNHERLADLNIELINWLSREMNITCEVVQSSSLPVVGQRVELLLSLCAQVNAERYLSPYGAKAYIAESDLFARENIELVYHDYQHPVYQQLHGAFLPYMSALDLLFNEGPASLYIIRSGRTRGIVNEY